MDRRSFIASSFAALAAPGALLREPITFKGVPLVFISTPVRSNWKNWMGRYSDPTVTRADIIACWEERDGGGSNAGSC